MVRLRVPDEGRIVFDDMVKGHIAVDVSELDDMVLRRADGMPTYNMAVVVDDHDMGVTHVLRGDRSCFQHAQADSAVSGPRL